MEPIDYPEIVLLVIEKSKSIPGSRSYMFDADVLIDILFSHQETDRNGMTSMATDVIPLAEEIKPRSEWNITPEQAQQAGDRLRQKRLKEREERRNQWGR